MKRIVCLLAVVLLVLAGCGGPEVPTTQPATVPTTAAPTEPTIPQFEWIQSGPVKLTRVGSFAHQSNILFAYGDFLLSYDKQMPDAPYQLLSPLGQSQLTGHYNAAAYYGNGIALVSQPGGLVGLVDYRAGREITPCEAKQIIQLSDRYFLLIYPDGTVRFADVTAGLVPELILPAVPDAYGVWGEGIYVCRGDVTEVYLADGALALSLENATVVDNHAIQGAFGGVHVYGPDHTEIAQLKHASQRLDLIKGGYLRFYDEGAYSVLDLQGHPVCEETFQDVQQVTDGYIIACKDALWGVTALTGEQICPYLYETVEYLGSGRFLLKDASGSRFLYDVFGEKIDITEFEGAGLYYSRKTAEGLEYLLQYGGETKLFAGEVTELDFGLVLTEDGLFELYSGKQIFVGYDYDRIEYCDGYVYARMLGIWTVFQVEIVK